MIKPTPKTEKAPQTAAARAAIAIHVTDVEFDTTNPAWVQFDLGMTAQLAGLEREHGHLATPLSLTKKFENKRR